MMLNSNKVRWLFVNRDCMSAPLCVCMFTMQNSWSYSAYMSMQIFPLEGNANIFQSRREMLTGRSMERFIILGHRLLVKVQMDTPGSMLYRQ